MENGIIVYLFWGIGIAGVIVSAAICIYSLIRREADNSVFTLRLGINLILVACVYFLTTWSAKIIFENFSAALAVGMDLLVFCLTFGAVISVLREERHTEEAGVGDSIPEACEVEPDIEVVVVDG